MSGIDLIPTSWREQRRLRVAARHFAQGFGVCLLVLVGARLWLFVALQEVQKSKAILEAQSQELAQHMANNKTALDRLQRLRQLNSRLDNSRNNSLTKSVLMPLDDDLSADIRLERLNISMGKREGDRAKAPMQLAISGLANNAAHLTAFTQNMTARAQWQNMKVLSMKPGKDALGVDFSLEITVMPLDAKKDKP